MSVQPVDLDLNLNAQDYVQSAGLALAATNNLNSSIGRLGSTAALAQRGLALATPSRAHIAGFGAAAAAAAANQQALSGLAATQAITSQSSKVLEQGINSLARSFPTGQRGAQQIIESVNQLGLSGKGTEAQIVSLSKVVANLGSATGEFSPALAQGLTQLNRTFGNQGLDPARVKMTGDSLVFTSKAAGVSAQGMLDFANSIAPATKQAGIGASATLGIAAAFSQIGQDSGAASTAVYKMLSDMNRAVRDGTPDMAVYAQAVGMTASSFKEMYQQDPTKTLSSVTKALGQGPAGSRALDALGLDGVRTQRALQALSTSGNLDKALQQAIGSRGSGATDRAAQAANDGVVASMTRVSSAAEQVAVAFGTPLLKPLGLFAKGLAGGIGVISRVATSGIGGKALDVAAYGGLGLLALRRLIGVGSTTAVVRQIGTSGPIGGLIGGFRAAGGTAVTTDAFGRSTMGSGMWSRTAGEVGRAYNEGRLDPSHPEANAMTGITRGAWNLGAGIRTGLGTPLNNGAPGLFRSIGAAGWRGGLWSLNAYGRTMQAQAEMAGTRDPTQRSDVWNRVMGRAGLGANHPLMPQSMKDDIKAGNIPSATDAAAFKSAIQASAKEFGTVPQAVRGLVRGMASTVGAIPRAAGALINSTVGWTGLAVMGGMTLATMAMNSRSNQVQGYKTEMDRAAQTAGANSGASGDYNSYAESIGRSGDATAAFQQRQIGVGGQGLSSGPVSLASATSVNPSDMLAANSSKSQVAVAMDPNSSVAQVAARVRLAMANSPQDPSILQSTKVDLLRQFSPDFVNSVMSTVGATPAPGQGGTLSVGGAAAGNPAVIAGTGFNTNDITTLVGQASDMKLSASGLAGMSSFLGRGPNSKGNRVSAREYYQPGFGKAISGDVHLSGAARSTLDTVQKSVNDQFANQSSQYGQAYGRQEQFQAINAALMAAAKSGNEATVNELGDRFARDLMGPGYKIPRITSADILSKGGFIQALQAADSSNKEGHFGNWYSSQTTGTKISLDPNVAGETPVVQPGLYSNMINQHNAQPNAQQISPDVANVFDQSKLLQPPSNMTPTQAEGYGVGAAVQAATGPQAGNAGYQQQTVQNFVQYLQDTGHSFSDIIQQAGQLASTFGTTNDAAHQMAIAMVGETQRRENQQAPFQNTPQQLQQQLSDAQSMLNVPLVDPNNPNSPQNADAIALHNQGQQTQDSANSRVADFLKQRIVQWRDYNIQVSRSQQDFGTQQTRANYQFGLSESRAQEDHLKQMAYARDDYNLTVTRANEDYHTQQQRQQRDFNLSMERGQQDYLTQQGRAIRDFNKQLKREIEDQAQALYDPYKRIQTQAIWDANSLVANLGEQNQAIAKQAAQLKRIQQMGVSQQSIQQLKLNDPSNAQQLNQMVNDLVNDPTLVRQVNAAAATRLTLGAQLLNDPNNKELSRQKSDFATSLGDMETDYKKTTARAQADFSKSQSDQAADFARNLGRMYKDYQTSTNRTDDQYAVSTRRAADDFATQMKNMEIDYQTQLGRMHTDIINATQEITVGKGGVQDLWTALQTTMAGSMTDVNNLMSNGLDATLKIIQSKKPAAAAAYANLFPYDLNAIFGPGGINLGGGSTSGNAGIPSSPGPGNSNPNPGGNGITYHGGAFGGPAGFAETLAAQHGGQAGGSGDAAMKGRHGDMGYIGIEEAVADLGFSFGMPTEGQTTRGGEGGTLHGAGRAVDFGNASSDSAAIAKALLPYAMGPGAPIEELIYSPLGIGYKNGINIGEAGYGANTWAQHFDHVHVGTKAGVSLDKFIKGGAAAGMLAMAPLTFDFSDAKGPWAKLIAQADVMKGLASWVGSVQQIEAQQASAFGTGGAVPNSAAAAQGPLQDYAKALLAERGWSGQWDSFDKVEMKEAGWDPLINNGGGHAPPSHNRAYGIPQALPPEKMASAGPDWATNGYTQLRWMMQYIANTYHDPNGAWAHEQSAGWYGNGAIVNGPHVMGVGERGPEAIIPLNHQGAQVLASAIGNVVKSDDLVGMMTHGRQDRVVYHSEIQQIDQRSIFQGDITVQSQDPLDMQRKLEARKRATNLTRRTPARIS